MQKGYKRQARGMAVLRCFIGLFIMIVVILLAYFMLRLDYSDKLDPNASMRPYVEVTPTPAPTVVPEVTEVPAVVDTATDAPEATAVIEATANPTQAPTAEPTATPEPTEAPTPTPAPTSIPAEKVSALKFSGFQLPNLTTKAAKLGISHSYRSEADGNKYLLLQGYAFIDEAAYDGSAASMYLVVTRSSGQSALVLPSRSVGVSGVDHSGALCANPSDSEFEAIIDVSQFPDDTYTLGVVLMYKDGGNACTEYAVFPSEVSFSVLNQQVISDVPVTVE